MLDLFPEYKSKEKKCEQRKWMSHYQRIYNNVVFQGFSGTPHK